MAGKLAGLPELLDQLDVAISVMRGSLESNNLDLIRLTTGPMLSSVRAINDVLPIDLKKPKGPFRRLQGHATFVKRFLDKGDLAYVRSNVEALGPDMIRLRAELAPAISGPYNDVDVNVEELPSSPSKVHLKDAVANYTAGTFGSAIASAVNALEGYLRRMRETRMKIDAGKGRFLDVILDLEKGGHLTKTEAPLDHILRLYRNLSDHPSDFRPTAAQARMVIQFVFATLKTTGS